MGRLSGNRQVVSRSGDSAGPRGSQLRSRVESRVSNRVRDGGGGGPIRPLHSEGCALGRRTVSSFSFYPELFEYRNQVIAELSDAGFEWLSHYSSVDPLHDVHGIEVCGIHQERDAREIQSLLCRLFPTWTPG